MCGHGAASLPRPGFPPVLPPDHPAYSSLAGASTFPHMNPVPKHSTLITAERVQMSIRTRFNPIPALTPRLLGAWLESFRLGFFRNIALAWDAIERRDYTLASVAAKRKKAVARNGWEILTVNDSPAAQEQKRALEYFYNHLTCTTALEENETGGLGLLIRQMMDAVGKRYAVHEIIWQPGGRAGDGAANLTATFRFCPLWWFEGTRVFEKTFNVFDHLATPGNLSSAVFVQKSFSHCFLNVGPTQAFNQFNMISTGAQIIEALGWALKPFTDAAAPAPFQIGTVTPALVPPFKEVRDITCAEVIHQMLRWSPDAVTWFDYTTSPPTFHCNVRANLATVNVDVSQT